MFFGPKTESFAAVCKEAMESQAGHPKEKREKPKGHGRNGADAFPRAKRIQVALDRRKDTPDEGTRDEMIALVVEEFGPYLDPANYQS